MSNLPQGLHERDIPGCSSRDEFLQRKREQIDDTLNSSEIPTWLCEAIMATTDFAQIAERCDWLYEAISADPVDNLQGPAISNTLYAARNLAQQADDGHEPEPEYEKEDELP